MHARSVARFRSFLAHLRAARLKHDINDEDLIRANLVNVHWLTHYAEAIRIPATEWLADGHRSSADQLARLPSGVLRASRFIIRVRRPGCTESKRLTHHSHIVYVNILTIFRWLFCHYDGVSPVSRSFMGEHATGWCLRRHLQHLSVHYTREHPQTSSLWRLKPFTATGGSSWLQRRLKRTYADPACHSAIPLPLDWYAIRHCKHDSSSCIRHFTAHLCMCVFCLPLLPLQRDGATASTSHATNVAMGSICTGQVCSLLIPADACPAHHRGSHGAASSHRDGRQRCHERTARW